jgi:hypothetical protein
MGFTIKEKAFLLDYFRKRVKQENEDWPYFVPPYCIYIYIYISLLMVKKMEKSQLKKYFKIKPQLKKSR